jgi:membrane protein
MKISRFHQTPAWRVLRTAADGFSRHQSARTAAYLAYTTLFALVPLMAVSFWLMSQLPQLSDIERSLQHWLFANLLPAAGKEVEFYLSTFAGQAASLQGAGLAMLFLTCLLMVRRIEVAFNTLWEVAEQRAGVRGLLVYWSIVTLGPCLLAAVFLTFSWLASLTGLGAAMNDRFVPAIMQGLFPVLVMAAVLTLAYALIPNTRVAWRHAALGGIVAAVLFDALRHMAVFLIGLFPSYQVIYGAFAAVPLFLLWIEAGWAIVLLGAHLAAAARSVAAARTDDARARDMGKRDTG